MRLCLALLLLLVGCAAVAPRPAPQVDPTYPGEANDLRRCQDGDDLTRLSYADWPSSWLDACTRVGQTWQKQGDPAKAEVALRKACPASAEAANGAVSAEACASLGELLRAQGRVAEARAALEDYTCLAAPDRYPEACRWLAASYLEQPGGQARARALYRRLCPVDSASCAALKGLGEAVLSGEHRQAAVGSQR